MDESPPISTFVMDESPLKIDESPLPKYLFRYKKKPGAMAGLWV
jgi:hypothetical protein